MALFTESSVRNRARKESTNFSKASSDLLAERVQKQASVSGFDIFFSHAFDDKELLEGTLLLLEDLGYSVYLDWKNDPQLDRTKVTTATAATLRKRMESCRCLLFAVTPDAKDSVWMRWELGWKDGENGRVAILPIEGSTTDKWEGQQFLGLYPYASDGPIKSTGVMESRNFSRNVAESGLIDRIIATDRGKADTNPDIVSGFGERRNTISPAVLRLQAITIIQFGKPQRKRVTWR